MWKYYKLTGPPDSWEEEIKIVLTGIVSRCLCPSEFRSWFLRRSRSPLTRSLSKERVRSDLRRFKNRIQGKERVMSDLNLVLRTESSFDFLGRS